MIGLLCIPPVVVMAVSDLRSRRVAVVQLLLFGVAVLAASLLESGWRAVAINTAFNLLTALLLCAALYGWSRLRGMKLPQMVGGGDLGFVLAVTPYFEPRGFVLYLVASCLLTLVVWWLCGIRSERPRDIPLVTGLGVCLAGMIFYRIMI